jgi:hypothetical protein
MRLRLRLGRLEQRVGPPPAPQPLPSVEELDRGLRAWVRGQTYNRGVFDADPEFRPAWSRYHQLWEVHTGGYSPLQAVWLARPEPEFEAARRRVVAVMVRLLERQPEPLRSLGVLLASAIPEDPPPALAALGP